ncbi:MAG TPA: hypothetical protein PLW65_00495 [Pseudomonadota bacterium]|nr:hypothetical protein [Pseudomonadota bacterium]
MARDLSAAKAARVNLIVWLGLAALFIVVLMAGLILIVVRGSVLRPLAALNQKLEEFAGGTPSFMSGDFDRCCSEVRQLAASCQKIAAARRAPAEGGP